MKTVSISEARNQLSAFIKRATQDKDDVVIQNRGRPEAVIIPYTDYEILQEARENERRKKAIQALQQIAEEVGSRNRSLSEQETEKLADEITREAVDRLVQKGNVRFQE
ncbi:type II toxin-antitoxin system Phd/YefM family antitoxin [Candidatus Leptofilum sp.]|uniref:type II toxin-antitoxin system Phd/YefM family antitoxin n=1 Tax=Candidatus Leptofilum sp. TaxID=3241576 RepID=UPI003B5919E8